MQNPENVVLNHTDVSGVIEIDKLLKVLWRVLFEVLLHLLDFFSAEIEGTDRAQDIKVGHLEPRVGLHSSENFEYLLNRRAPSNFIFVGAYKNGPLGW